MTTLLLSRAAWNPKKHTSFCMFLSRHLGHKAAVLQRMHMGRWVFLHDSSWDHLHGAECHGCGFKSRGKTGKGLVQNSMSIPERSNKTIQNLSWVMYVSVSWSKEVPGHRRHPISINFSLWAVSDVVFLRLFQVTLDWVRTPWTLMRSSLWAETTLLSLLHQQCKP